MAPFRRRIRWLAAALVGTGLLWIMAENYARLGLAPWDMSLSEAVIFYGGGASMVVVLDFVAAFYLRRFFAALARVRSGETLPQEELEAAAGPAIHFPWRAALWLLVLGLILTVLFHTAQHGSEIFATLRDPADRTDLLLLVIGEINETLILALLLFSVSGRLLRPAIASLGLRRSPGGLRIPLGVRSSLVVATQGISAVFLLIGNPDVPLYRLVWLDATLMLLFVASAYIVATDAQTDLEATASRLRVLAGGLRPDLFHRLAVTGTDEVSDLITAINLLQDRVEGEFHAIQRDLAMARSIQMAMLPRTLKSPPGWDLAVRLMPAQDVGGDFYDLIPFTDGRLGVAVGDAAGKGLPAALIMSAAVSLIRSHAPGITSPGEVLGTVNRLLCDTLTPTMFVTAIYAVIDPERGEMRFASAGHFPPLLGGREPDLQPSLPLGVDPGTVYREACFQLRPSEPILFFSDGLVEAPDPNGHVLGMEAAGVGLGRPGRGALQLLDEIFVMIARHTGGRPQADDITALVLVPPAEQRLDLPSRPGADMEAAAWAANFARAQGQAHRADAVATAVGELCRNAIVHGNGLDPEVPVNLRLRAGPGWFEATVADRGVLFALPSGPPDLAQQMEGDDPIHGWGLHLVRALAGEVRIEPTDSGKQVRVRFVGEGMQHV